MKQTENYQLNQWEPTDRVTRAADNADNARIDAALGELRTAVEGGGFVVGTYGGNGSFPRVIELGFRPKAVLSFRSDGVSNNQGQIFGGLFSPSSGLSVVASVVDNGFRLAGGYTNVSGTAYIYIAFK